MRRQQMTLKCLDGNSPIRFKRQERCRDARTFRQLLPLNNGRDFIASPSQFSTVPPVQNSCSSCPVDNIPKANRFRGAVVQSLNVPANSLVFDYFSYGCIPEQLRISQIILPRPTASTHLSAAPQLALHAVENPASNCKAVPTMIRFGKSCSQLTRDFHLQRHASQRIFRRLISVRRRIERRPLNVRIVIGTAAVMFTSRISSSSSKDKNQIVSLRSILWDAVIHAESPAVRNQVVMSFGNSGPNFPFADWDDRGEMAQCQTRRNRTPICSPGAIERIPCTTFSQNRVRSRSFAVWPSPRMRAQEFVPRYPWQCLMSTKFEAQFTRHFSRAMKLFDDRADSASVRSG